MVLILMCESNKEMKLCVGARFIAGANDENVVGMMIKKTMIEANDD